MEQQKDGTITAEEAQAQLAELGVELPTRGGKIDKFSGLDEETKNKYRPSWNSKKMERSQLKKLKHN